MLICADAGTTRPRQRVEVMPATGASHTRWQTFIDRKKTPVIANAAIARELAGWCWSLAVLDA